MKIYTTILFLINAFHLNAQVKFIPVIESFAINYSLIEDSCNCLQYGNFDNDNLIDTCFAVQANHYDVLKGIIIHFGNGLKTILFAGNPTPIIVSYDNKKKKIPGYEIEFINWELYNCSAIIKLSKLPIADYPTDRLIAGAIKIYGIKPQSDLLFLDLGDFDLFALFRFHNKWRLIALT